MWRGNWLDFVLELPTTINEKPIVIRLEHSLHSRSVTHCLAKVFYARFTVSVKYTMFLHELGSYKTELCMKFCVLRHRRFLTKKCIFGTHHLTYFQMGVNLQWKEKKNVYKPIKKLVYLFLASWATEKRWEKNEVQVS